MATGIGETLRAAREERGLTLSDVAEETAINRRKLQALEEERFDLLDGDVYVRSSLRLYGRFLRIDPEPLVETYREEYGDYVADVPLTPVGDAPARVSPVVTFAVVALVVVTGLGLIGALGGGSSLETAADHGVDTDAVAGAQGPAPAPTPSVSATSPGGGDGDAATPAPEPTGAAPLAESDQVELALNVTGGESWVRVTVDDQRVLERTLEEGFSQVFTGDEIQMRLGNAGAADVVVNGEQLQEFASGDVVDVTCAAGESSCTID